MGRKHKKVREYTPVSKTCALNEAHTWEAMEQAKDVLWHIKKGNPSWGTEWYDCVRANFFKSALRIVEQSGKGESLIPAISALNQLIDLNEHMKRF